MSIRDRSDIEIYVELINIWSILKVESTSKNPRRIDDVDSPFKIDEISVKFQRRINSESTKMCQLAKAYGNDI